MEILTAAVTLLLIMDPIGNILVFMSVLNQLDPQRRHRVLVRELLISLAVLLVFLFLGGEQARWPKNTNRDWRNFNRCLKVWLGRQEEKTITGSAAVRRSVFGPNDRYLAM
jgi:MarC family integral membrane protein